MSIRVKFENIDHSELMIRYRAGAESAHVAIEQGRNVERDFPGNQLTFAWKRKLARINEAELNLFGVTLWQETEVKFQAPPGEVIDQQRQCFVVNQTSNLTVTESRWSLSGQNQWSEWKPVDTPISRTCTLDDALTCANKQQWKYLLNVPGDKLVDIQFRIRDETGATITYSELGKFSSQVPLFVTVPGIPITANARAKNERLNADKLFTAWLSNYTSTLAPNRALLHIRRAEPQSATRNYFQRFKVHTATLDGAGQSPSDVTCVVVEVSETDQRARIAPELECNKLKDL